MRLLNTIQNWISRPRVGGSGASTSDVAKKLATTITASENRQQIALATALMFVIAALNYYVPYLTGEIVEEMPDIKPWSFFTLALVSSIAKLAPSFRDRVLTEVGAHSTRRMIREVSDTLMNKRALSYHIDTPSPDMMMIYSKATAIQKMAILLLTQIFPTIIELTTVATVFSVQYGMEMAAYLAMMMFSIAAFSANRSTEIVKANANWLKEGLSAWSILVRTTTEYKSIHDAVKVPAVLQSVDQATRKTSAGEINASSVAMMTDCGYIAIAATFMALVLNSVYRQTATQSFSKQDCVILLSLTTRVYNLALGLGQATSNVLAGVPDIKLVVDELSKPPEVNDPFPHQLLHIGTDGPKIEFKHVTFSYNAQSKHSCQLNFTVLPGQRTAFVGPSGAGKSTVFNLLSRYFIPQDGQILIDGTDIQYVGLASLRSQIGVVAQTPNLFNASVRDNILFAINGRVDDAIIYEIAEQVGLREFLDDLPQGLDTPAGEGGQQLSGGQQQKVAIIRGLLKNAPILILDEFTSALDAESARRVLDGVRKMSDKTVLAITHKLHEIQDFGSIVVLHEGKVVAQGTHDELLERCTVYSELYAQQGGSSDTNNASAGEVPGMRMR